MRHDGVAAGDQHERIAVGRRLGGGRRRNRAAGAGAVLDDDGLAPAPGELVAERAGHDVDRPARRERHQQVHRLRREGVLRARGPGGTQERRNQHGKQAQ